MFVVGGESLIDLVPVKGTDTREAKAGGSPYNCAIALAKLGADTGFLCPISQDAHGDLLLAPLIEARVRLLLPERVAAATTEAIITFDDHGNARYRFERGADRAFTRDQLIAALPRRIELFEIGGFCPLEAEDTAIWLDVAREVARRGATLTMDPNIRPQGLDFAAFKRRLSQFLDLVAVVKVSVEDLTALDRNREVKEGELSTAEVEAIVRRSVDDLLGRANIGLVVVTFGREGSRAYTRTAEAHHGIYSVPVRPGEDVSKTRDTIGAGDTLMAGILSWLTDHGHLAGGLSRLDAAGLERMLRFGAVAAGLNCAQLGCQPPTRAEVDAVLSARG